MEPEVRRRAVVVLQGLSAELADEERKSRLLCKRRGWDVAGIYHVAGLSGRPDLSALYDHAMAGQIDVVIAQDGKDAFAWRYYSLLIDKMPPLLPRLRAMKVDVVSRLNAKALQRPAVSVTPEEAAQIAAGREAQRAALDAEIQAGIEREERWLEEIEEERQEALAESIGSLEPWQRDLVRWNPEGSSGTAQGSGEPRSE